jgi:hypothetical protein
MTKGQLDDLLWEISMLIGDIEDHWACEVKRRKTSFRFGDTMNLVMVRDLLKLVHKSLPIKLGEWQDQMEAIVVTPEDVQQQQELKKALGLEDELDNSWGY